MCVANIALWKRNTCISVIWNVPSIAKHRRWPPGHCVHLVWGEWAAPPVHCFHHCAWQNTSLQRASQKGPPEPKHLSTKNELPHEFPLSKGIPAMFWFSSSHRVFFRVTFRGIIKQRRWKEITLKRHDIVHIIYINIEREGMKRYSDCPASSWRYAANVEDFECGKCGLTSIEWRAGDSTETVYLPQDKILSQLSVKENVQNPQLHFSTHLHIISLNICRNRSKATPATKMNSICSMPLMRLR